MGRLLALDSGLTVTKAVIFDTGGRQLAVARRYPAQLMPEPHRVERDMDDLWQSAAGAIRDVLQQSATDPGDIIAVAATAHGDGLYLLDPEGAPLGLGILSLDSRARQIVEDWQMSGVAGQSLALTGQVPHVSAPSALLAWIQRNAPDRFARIGHVLACKDWLRFCLTGQIGTDRTEASTSFTEVTAQSYSDDALRLFDLGDLEAALPSAAPSAEIVGTVSPEAAAVTGLVAGTPVAAGLHDVTASALGIGAHRPGVIGVVAGTYSINACVSSTPVVDADWFCRNAVQPGQWNNMAISPASTANYDWFLDTFCATDRAAAAAQGRTIHDLLAPEIDAALGRSSSVLYHPFLFGAPHGPAASAGFFGLRGWHGRGDVLAALLEGIVFNHRYHIDALRRRFPAQAVHLTGGASRNPAVARLFADILDLPVTVTATDEAAAWGAALCAGAATGVFDRFDADPRDLAACAITYRPRADQAARYNQRYAAYLRLVQTLPASWEQLNALAAPGMRGADD